MYNYVYVYFYIHIHTEKLVMFPVQNICMYVYIYIHIYNILVGFTDHFVVPWNSPQTWPPADPFEGRKLNNEKSGLSQPQKERIGTSNPSFSGAKDGKFCFQEFLRLVALKMFFFETTSSPTGVPSPPRHGGFVWWSFLVLDVFTVRNLPYSLWQAIQEEIADDFLLEKKVEKEPLECTISFFFNLCFNIFNPSSRQGPNSTHLWVLGLSLGLGFCLNLGFCLRLCLDFMEEEEEAKKCQMPHHQGKDSIPPTFMLKLPIHQLNLNWEVAHA